MKKRSHVRHRRLGATLTLLLIAAFAWLVAPALSTERYMPAATDFTMPIEQVRKLDRPTAERFAAGARHGKEAGRRQKHGHRQGAIRYRTPPLEAPKRFDLVGVADGKGPFEYRVRERGEAWSDWVETDPGAPVYTGGSDFVQVRSRRAPIRGELYFVNVSGDTSALSGVVNRLRSAVNSALISIVPGSAEADATVTMPKFVTRREWGANRKAGGCRPRSKPQYGRVKAGVVHHTVSINSYSEAEAPGMILAICRFHRNGNGWNDIGYNALVDRFGNLYQGRAGGMRRPVVGAQAEGINAQTAGISALGNYEQVRPSRKTIKSIVTYLAWRLDLAGIKRATGRTRLLSAGGSTQRTPEGRRVRVPRIFEHGRTNYTDCAGRFLNAKIGKIRRQTQRRIRKGRRGGPSKEPQAPEQPTPEQPPEDDGGTPVPQPQAR